jgi:imidazolonepropionase-like amidohydrolase
MMRMRCDRRVAALLPVAVFAMLPVAALLVLPAVTLAETLALVGATVHPVSAAVIDDAVVLIEDGRIAAVGTDVAIPDGARRIELTGKRLYPGLLNASTILGLTEIGAVAATRDDKDVGGMNPHLRSEVAVNPSSELIPVTRAGGVLMALTAVAGGRIPGTAALIYTDGWTWEEMTLEAPVALVVRWPGMRVDRSHRAKKKPEEQIEAREQAIDRLREFFADARAYWQAREASDVPHQDEDVKWEAMGAVLRGELPVIVRANDLMQIRAALDWAEEEHIRLILEGAGDAWRVADELAAREVPVIVRKPTKMPLRNYEPYDTGYANAARLHEAGVRFAFSTDGASNARNLSFEAGLAVAYGLPAEAALAAMTLEPARIFGIDARVGSIEVGKEATLIATDGDLLDFRSHVVGAWIAGREVDLIDRHRRLYEKYDARPRPEG